MNQLHHVRFLKQVGGIDSLMKQHAAILKPKFDMVQSVLETELGGKSIAEWSKPKGGYFVSLNTMEGCAKAVVNMAAKAGVKLTPAGATFPYGKDPLDRNIRIAPILPVRGRNPSSHGTAGDLHPGGEHRKDHAKGKVTARPLRRFSLIGWACLSDPQ